MNEEEQALTW